MAESHRNEIARLEALFSAHPEGRMFTHLAEAYRKAGELDRAREVLEHGLRRHPDYASAHVVLGRVLADQGKVEEAAAAFRRVLELDPQNLVALRACADLAREAGRRDEALGYYREILALDPANEEVAELIRGLEEAGPGEENGAAALGGEQFGWGGEGGPMEGGVVAEEVGDAGMPGAGMEPWWSGETGDSAEVESGEPVWSGESAADGAVEASFAQADFGATDWEPGSTDWEPGSVEPPAGFVGADGGFEEMGFGEGGEFGSLDLSGLEGGPMDPADLWGPDAEAGVEDDLAGETVSLEGMTVEFGAVAEEEEVPAADLDGPPEDWLLDEPGEELGGGLVTETMGDVYARQGLHDLAAQVYRELLKERPGDARLESKLRDAEAQAQAASAAGPPGGAEVEAFGEGAASGAAASGAVDVGTTEESEVGAGPFAGGEPRGSTEPFGSGEPFAWSEPFGSHEPEVWVAAAGEGAGSGFEGAADEPASGEPAFLEIESAWTGAAGAVEVEQTPYAWMEEVGGGEQGSGVGTEPSIGEYFQALLGWRPGGGGVATESVPHAAATPSEPFVLDEPSGAPAAAVGVGDEIEELFGGAPAAAPEAGAEGVESAPQPQGGEDDDDDDLEMFRAWLQSLKR